MFDVDKLDRTLGDAVHRAGATASDFLLISPTSESARLFEGVSRHRFGARVDDGYPPDCFRLPDLIGDIESAISVLGFHRLSALAPPIGVLYRMSVPMLAQLGVDVDASADVEHRRTS